MADCTIKLDRPVSEVKAVNAAESAEYSRGVSAVESLRRQAEAELNNIQLARKAMDSAAASVQEVYRRVCSEHAAEIAQLAVEIACKVLRVRIDQGDYAIRDIIEDALREAPVRHDIRVRVNPLDIEHCRGWQPEGHEPLTFVADPSVGRAECLVETPKGSVESFIEQHMERISEALRSSHCGA